MKSFNPRNKIFLQTKLLKGFVPKLGKKKKKKWNIIRKLNKNIYYHKWLKKYTYRKRPRYNKKMNLLRKFFFFSLKLKKKKKKLLSVFFKKNEKLKKKYLSILNLFNKNSKIYVKFLRERGKFYPTKKKAIFYKKCIHRIPNISEKKIFEFQTYNKDYYKIVLHLKQILKLTHGCINNHNIKKIFKMFIKLKKKKNINLYSFLNSKIDVCLILSGLAKNSFEAKQLILHKKITVNNKIILSNNFFLKPGDFFSIKKENIIPVKKGLPANLMYNYSLNSFIFIRYLFKNESINYYKFNYNFKLLTYSLSK